MRVATALACLLLLPASVLAQQREIERAGLPSGVEARLRLLLAQPGTRVVRGEAHIGPQEDVAGSLVVMDGPAFIAGTIHGDLVMVNGSLALDPGARVDGDVTVVAGTLRGTETAMLSGTVTVFGEGFDIADHPTRLAGWERWRDGDRELGVSTLRLRVEQNYNRVEGLPLEVGPDILSGGPLPIHLEAMAIWRTAAGGPFDTEHLGYVARAEQYLDRNGTVRLGASARSAIAPIEPRGLTDLEASLGAALLHNDLRDYYERTGWSAYARLAPRHGWLDATLEYRDERHASAGIRDPWALFHGDATWRAQPLVAEGRSRALVATMEVDARRGRAALRGWYARIEAQRVLDSDLSVPVAPGVSDIQARPFADAFTLGAVDLRRYARITRDGTLNVRVLAGGALADMGLPPQYQHAVGGPGTLPGYDQLSGDCGARAFTTPRAGSSSDERFFAAYGCDRFAVMQAEYRGGMRLRVGDHDRRGHHDWNWHHFDMDPAWVVFFDAGRGWAHVDGTDAIDTGALYDAGAGIILGGIGFYGAVPLTGVDRRARFMVRLGPRF